MKINNFVGFFLMIFLATQVYASERVSFGIGESKDSASIYRLGFQKQFDNKWFESKTGNLSVYYELSLNYWKYNDESVKGIAFSPVFIYEFSGLDTITPYLEAGIGVAYISQKTIGNRDLSSHFQFEDRVGLGVKFGEHKTHDLGFKYLHYSNAGIKEPNEGIDILMCTYTYSFK